MYIQDFELLMTSFNAIELENFIILLISVDRSPQFTKQRPE